MVVIQHWLEGVKANRHLIALAGGQWAVELFFVLSGFVITTALLAQKDRSGSIRVGAFYRRRLGKLVPTLYAFIGAALLLGWVYRTHLPTRDLLSALTFSLGHYRYSSVYLFAHTWSLSVELVFYLAIAPLLSRFSQRQLSMLAIALLLLSPLCRAYNFEMLRYYFAHQLHNRPGWPRHIPIFDCADVLVVGAVAAIIRQRHAARLSSWRILGSAGLRTLLLLLLALGPVLEALDAMSLPLRAIWSLIAAAAAATLILSVTARQRGLFFDFLNWRPMLALGLASYSIYVWQELFLLPFPGMAHLLSWQSPYFNWIFAIVAGFAAYHFIERPMAARFYTESH